MIRQKIRFVIAAFMLSGILFFGTEKCALAQGNIRIIHTITKESNGDIPYLGRDLWFCIPANATGDNNGKVFSIYVNSPRNGTVNFQIQGSKVIQKPLTANKVTIFATPVDFRTTPELITSGVVEGSSAIHIWSDNADIAVYFISRVTFSTDGMYVIPTTGWGKKYVVGAYPSLEVSQSAGVDYPSEFAVVANQDATNISIIPNYDIRGSSPTSVLHPAGIPFSEQLNRGDCVQYQVVGDPSSDAYDLTGSIITSNNPIGVMGASVCPFIRPDEPSCDYILDMMQPVRTWSNVYYTAPFAGRKYGGDAFLVVGTYDGQKIFRDGTQVAVLSPQYGYLYLYEDVAGVPSKWTSDSSFMLMQYVCSSTHDAPSVGNRNLGDPASVVINPADQFAKKVYFQTPTIKPGSGQTDFTNYVNVIVDTNYIDSTIYDKVPLLRKPKSIPPGVQTRQDFLIPNTEWEVVRLTYAPSNGQGTHIVSCQIGVGVYVYGYGSDDSYAWAGNLGTKSLNDPDTVPPVVNPYGPCFCAHVSMSDIGPLQSKLSSFIADSSENIAFFPDTSFLPGAGMDTSFYDICVMDSSLPAYISVSIYDIAGNRTTVFSSYKPDTVKFSPSPLNFGTVLVPGTKTLYDTICNTGSVPYHFRANNLYLTSNGTKIDSKLSFSIDSAADGDIPVAGCRIIKLTFNSIIAPTVKDTIKLSDECQSQQLVILGNGGQGGFDISDYSFDCTALNTIRQSIGYVITDPTGISIIIDSVWLDNNTIFTYDKKTFPQNQPPFTVPAEDPNTLAVGQYEIIVTFNPTDTGIFKTIIHISGKIKGKDTVITATISGIACAPVITSTGGNGQTTCDFATGLQVPIKNTGNFYDSIISVLQKNNTPGFAIAVVDAQGNPVKLPLHLDTGKTIYASVTYTPNGTSGCFVDSVIVTRFGGIEAVDPAPFVTFCEKFFKMSVTAPINYGTIPYGSAKIRDSMEVCNTGPDTLTISAIDSVMPHSSSFQLEGIYRINGVNKSFPNIQVAPGDCLEILVDFDPANSKVTNQSDSFAVTSNDCKNPVQNVFVLGALSIGGPTLQGFTDPPLFSCDVLTDSIIFTNPNKVAGKITNIGNSNGVNFIQLDNLTYPIVVPPGATNATHFKFVPNPVVPATPYTSNVTVTFDNGAGVISPFITTINAASQGWDLTVNSKFTGAASAASAGSFVTMPVQVSLNQHGVAKQKLAFLNIKKIQLTYTYNQAILDIDPTKVAAAVTFPVNPASPWSLDPANPPTIGPGTLQVNLINASGVLSDADITRPIAYITFKAVLPKAGDSTQMQLTSTSFLDNSNQPISPCTGVTKQDSNFTLQYLCGDSTIQGFLNGKLPMRANPVSPNPAGGASGNILSFKYSTIRQGNITLEVFDMLGNSVSRIIDNQSMPAGSFEARFNASRLDEGTYIYRYTLDNKNVISGRFVIQK